MLQLTAFLLIEPRGVGSYFDPEPSLVPDLLFVLWQSSQAGASLRVHSAPCGQKGNLSQSDSSAWTGRRSPILVFCSSRKDFCSGFENLARISSVSCVCACACAHTYLPGYTCQEQNKFPKEASHSPLLFPGVEGRGTLESEMWLQGCSKKGKLKEFVQE